MTVDQALFEMELVGHDFYLFSDVDSGRPAWSTAATPTTTASSAWRRISRPTQRAIRVAGR